MSKIPSKDERGRWIIRSHLDVLRFANPRTRQLGYAHTSSGGRKKDLHPDEFDCVKQCEREGLIVFVRYRMAPIEAFEPSGRPLTMIFELTPRGEAARAALP